MKRTIGMMTLVVVAVGIFFVSCQNKENNSNGGGQSEKEWVDLGLPSGLLWATCNLGANSPEESGYYYAWGETETKEVYNWSTYKYCTVDEDGYLRTLTKYNYLSNYGTTDNLITLDFIDDVATQKLGDGARMPTADEWRELYHNTTIESTNMNGVNGVKFTAANGKSLFLPAVDRYFGSDIIGVGYFGYYWSSSLYKGTPYSVNPDKALYYTYSLGSLGKVTMNMEHYFDRSSGFPVRAVRTQI